jgi:hypothetical protein
MVTQSLSNERRWSNVRYVLKTLTVLGLQVARQSSEKVQRSGIFDFRLRHLYKLWLIGCCAKLSCNLQEQVNRGTTDTQFNVIPPDSLRVHRCGKLITGPWESSFYLFCLS